MYLCMSKETMPGCAKDVPSNDGNVPNREFNNVTKVPFDKHEMYMYLCHFLNYSIRT